MFHAESRFIVVFKETDLVAYGATLENGIVVEDGKVNAYSA